MLTHTQSMGDTNPALANSSVRIRTRVVKGAHAPSKALFCARVMVGCAGALSGARFPLSRSTNPVQSATLSFVPESGGYKTIQRRHLMSNEIASFGFNSHPVRVFSDNDQIWFVAKDVCDALEYKHVPSAMRMLDEDEKDVRKVHTLGGLQNLNIVSESGMYHLAIKSRKPEAKKFRKWVTSEVLPSIRKTGSYGAQTLPMKHWHKVAQIRWHQLNAITKKVQKLSNELDALTGDLSNTTKNLYDPITEPLFHAEALPEHEQTVNELLSMQDQYRGVNH